MRLVLSDPRTEQIHHVPQAPQPRIEQRGRQHRVYWRNAVPGLPARSYCAFYRRDAAEQFVGMAGLLGLDTARQVTFTEDPLEATALLQVVLAERGLAPATPAPQGSPDPLSAPTGPTPLFTSSVDARLTGVTFEELWARFLIPPAAVLRPD